MSNMNSPTAAGDRYDVYVVEDYKDKAGEDKSTWTRVGAAWPHKDGKGFSIQLDAVPLNGDISIRAASEAKE